MKIILQLFIKYKVYVPSITLDENKYTNEVK